MLFGMEPNVNNLDFGKYGFGSERSLAQYEQYAGLRFKDRTVQRYTLQNKVPPNPVDDEWVCEVKHVLDFQKKFFPENDYETWWIEFYSAAGETVSRTDADKAEIEKLFSTKYDFVRIERKFITKTLPVKWLIRPYSTSKGWCNSITGVIAYR